MKPRLKLLNTGRLLVLQPAVLGIQESQLKRRLTRHYGSMSAFAVRFGFRYSDVVTALSVDTKSKAGTCAGVASAAGGVAEVRRVLGLRSEPSKTAIAQVAAQAKRRQALRAGATA